MNTTTQLMAVEVADVKILIQTLERAETFIRNGIELGYIKLPESPDDPACSTLGLMYETLSEFSKIQFTETPAVPQSIEQAAALIYEYVSNPDNDDASRSWNYRMYDKREAYIEGATSPATEAMWREKIKAEQTKHEAEDFQHLSKTWNDFYKDNEDYQTGFQEGYEAAKLQSPAAAEAKTLEQCKNNVAKRYYFADWETYVNHCRKIEDDGTLRESAMTLVALEWASQFKAAGYNTVRELKLDEIKDFAESVSHSESQRLYTIDVICKYNEELRKLNPTVEQKGVDLNNLPPLGPIYNTPVVDPVELLEWLFNNTYVDPIGSPEVIIKSFLSQQNQAKGGKDGKEI